MFDFFEVKVALSGVRVPPLGLLKESLVLELFGVRSLLVGEFLRINLGSSMSWTGARATSTLKSDSLKEPLPFLSNFVSYEQRALVSLSSCS